MPWQPDNRRDRAVAEMSKRVQEGKARKKSAWLQELERSLPDDSNKGKFWMQSEQRGNLKSDGTFDWPNEYQR